jgi:hypothetical protein
MTSDTQVAVMKHIQTALQALERSIITGTDRMLLLSVWQGLWELDEEQAKLKAALEDIHLRATTLEQAREIARRAYEPTVPGGGP